MNGRSSPDFGTRLKRARETKAVSLRQIAAATKISVVALEALERNDISRLPGGIFSRGIVRSYAIEVGLDPERAVRDFIEQFPTDAVTAGSPHVPPEDHAAIESDRRSAETVLKLVAISVPLAIAILYLTLSGGSARVKTAPVAPDPRRDPDRAPAPAVVPAAATGPATAAPPAGTEPGTTPHAPAATTAAQRPMVLTVTSSTGAWVDLTVDDVRVFSRMLAAGETTSVRAIGSIVMAVGDAGAVTFTLDDRPGIPLGTAGESRAVRITRDTLSSFVARQ